MGGAGRRAWGVGVGQNEEIAPHLPTWVSQHLLPPRKHARTAGTGGLKKAHLLVPPLFPPIG